MFSRNELRLQLFKLAYLKFIKFLKRNKVDISRFRLPETQMTRSITPKLRSLLSAILNTDKFTLSKQRGCFVWSLNGRDIWDSDNYEFSEYFNYHRAVKKVQEKYGFSYSWCDIKVFEYDDFIEFNSAVYKTIRKYKDYVQEMTQIREKIYEKWKNREERKKELMKNTTHTIQKKYDEIAVRKLKERGDNNG